MMARELRHLFGMIVLLWSAATQGGPSEIYALEQRLAEIDAQIAEAENQMKQTLGGYGQDPGKYGIELRTLKRERREVVRDLDAALAEQSKRDATREDAPVISTTPRRSIR